MNIVRNKLLLAGFALAANAAIASYGFEPAGVKAEGGGKSIVTIRLIHDGKPVTGAVVIQSRADMGLISMAAMTAPITFMGEQPGGTYRLEVTNGPVWESPTTQTALDSGGASKIFQLS